MKKILFTSVLFFSFVVFANAQTDKGDWMVGGNFKLNTSKENSEFNFSPTAGLFVENNFAFGGKFAIRHTNIGGIKNTRFDFGPYARYFFKSEKFMPFLQTDFTFISKQDNAVVSTAKTNGTSFFFGAGGSFFISENIAFELLGGYNQSKFKDKERSTGFDFSLGFQVYLRKSQVPNVN